MDIYNRYEALSPIHHGGLTNHLPMVLVALEKCGVDSEKIIQKLDSYKEDRGIFDLTDKASPVDEFDQEYINRTGFYLSELNHKGEDIVLGMFLNENRHSISAALFHGVIRLYYAKESKNPLQVAQALAYFELSLQDISIDVFELRNDEFYNHFEELREHVLNLDHKFEVNNTSGKMKEIMNLPIVKSGIAVMKNINKKEILDFVLTRYLETKDFYVLHLITGFHAIIELEEYLPNFDEMLKHYLAVAQIIMLLNPVKNEYQTQFTEEVYELMNSIEELEDFHDIKLLFSLRELSKLFDNEKIKYVANIIFER